MDTYGHHMDISVYGPNTESFGCRKALKGFRPDRDQRAPVPINRMRARVSVNPRSSAVSNRAIIVQKAPK